MVLREGQFPSPEVKFACPIKSSNQACFRDTMTVTRADLRKKVISLGSSSCRPNVNKVRELHSVEIRCKKTKELVDLEVI